MKKILLLGAFVLISMTAFSQTFTDDFESYTPGDFLGVSSPTWTTWTTGGEGGSEDVTVTDSNASSGSNALYFSSTSSNGGPQDVILPFEEVYNSGNFTFEANFLVENGKGAYFNLQGTNTVAEIWALDCFMLDDGTLKLANQSTPYLTTTYPIGVWFNLRIEMDLTANVWELFIDNVSFGSFANPTGTIGILDLFPTNPTNQGGNGISGFYVDDVIYNHIPADLPDLNGGVTFLGQLAGIAGGSSTVSTTVRNLGANEITSFDLTYEYNGNEVTDNITGLNLLSLESYSYEFPDQVTLISGNTPLTVTVSNVNGEGQDANEGDDSKSISIDPVTPAEGKMVLGEEATGTWCQWCPRGAVGMDYMESTYGDFWAGTAVHNGDPMVVAEHDSGLGTLIDGYPSGSVERQIGIDPSASGLEQAFLDAIVTPPTAFMQNGATYDADTRLLEVSVTSTFQMDASGDWRVGVIITEDGVTGTTNDYAQSNAYAGGGSGEMGGYELLSHPVPAAQMVYDHVSRAIAPSFAGKEDSFPLEVYEGDSFSNCFTFTLPEAWDDTKIHILSFLLNPNGSADNADKESITSAVENGLAECMTIATHTIIKPTFKMYPNPSNGVTYIDLENNSGKVNLKIYDFTGKIVGQQNYDVNGAVRLPIQTGKLARGIYLVSLTIGDTIQQQKLIVE